jgi:hypothetical protein
MVTTAPERSSVEACVGLTITLVSIPNVRKVLDPDQTIALGAAEVSGVWESARQQEDHVPTAHKMIPSIALGAAEASDVRESIRHQESHAPRVHKAIPTIVLGAAEDIGARQNVVQPCLLLSVRWLSTSTPRLALESAPPWRGI